MKKTGMLLVASVSLSFGGLSGQAATSVGAEVLRDYLVDAFQRNAAMDLAYLDAAPDSMLRWAPTPGVRDFTEQLFHVTHGFFQFWRPDYVLPDTARVLSDRDLLREEIVEAYEWAERRLLDLSDAELVETVDLTEELAAPRWREMQYWLDHAMWTRASLIPYLRLNGITPPPVRFW